MVCSSRTQCRSRTVSRTSVAMSRFSKIAHVRKVDKGFSSMVGREEGTRDKELWLPRTADNRDEW